MWCMWVGLKYMFRNWLCACLHIICRVRCFRKITWIAAGVELLVIRWYKFDVVDDVSLETQLLRCIAMKNITNDAIKLRPYYPNICLGELYYNFYNSISLHYYTLMLFWKKKDLQSGIRNLCILWLQTSTKQTLCYLSQMRFTWMNLAVVAQRVYIKKSNKKSVASSICLQKCIYRNLQ